MAGGAIFLGVGVGIAASGTIVPLLLDAAMRVTWLGVGLVPMMVFLVDYVARGLGWGTHTQRQQLSLVDGSRRRYAGNPLLADGVKKALAKPAGALL